MTDEDNAMKLLATATRAVAVLLTLAVILGMAGFAIARIGDFIDSAEDREKPYWCDRSQDYATPGQRVPEGCSS